MTWTVEYQTRRARIVSFELFLPLTGLRAAESDVESYVFGAIVVVSTLVFAAFGLAIVISGFRSSRLLEVLLLRASQLSSPTQKLVMSVVTAGMDFGFSWLRCPASHSSRMLCLKTARASASGQSMIWFFLVKNRVQNFLADSPACWVI